MPTNTTTLLRLPDVIQRVGLSRSALYRAVRRGTFPRQVPLAGTKAVGWSSAAVDQWIADQLDGAERAQS